MHGRKKVGGVSRKVSIRIGGLLLGSLGERVGHLGA